MKLKVSVAIEKKLVERLDRIAAISGESRSQVIDRMVRDQIETAEQFANLMSNPEARKTLMRQFANPDVLGPMLRAMGEKLGPDTAQKMAEAMESAGVAASKAYKKGKGKKS
jgi:hypothetical protein